MNSQPHPLLVIEFVIMLAAAIAAALDAPVWVGVVAAVVMWALLFLYGFNIIYPTK